MILRTIQKQDGCRKIGSKCQFSEARGTKPPKSDTASIGDGIGISIQDVSTNSYSYVKSMARCSFTLLNSSNQTSVCSVHPLMSWTRQTDGLALRDLLPWTELEKEYNSRLGNQKKSAVNKPARMILGAKIIKHKLNLSDAQRLAQGYPHPDGLAYEKQNVLRESVRLFPYEKRTLTAILRMYHQQEEMYRLKNEIQYGQSHRHYEGLRLLPSICDQIIIQQTLINYSNTNMEIKENYGSPVNPRV